MPSIYDVFTFYLKPADLLGKSHTVKITSAALVDVWDPKLKRKVPRLVLSFDKRKKVMAVTKTQAGDIEKITGTDDYSKWVGVDISLTQAPAGSDKITIKITKPTESKP